MKEVQSLGDIRFGTLARAAEGLTQWRPLLLAFLTLLLTGVVITLGQWLALNVAGILALVMMLLAFVVLMGGFSGVGIMLMDKAKEQPVRSFAAAASAGLLCLPKFLLIGLAMMAAFIVYMLLASVIYFIGKIPFIGGLIAFIAHPVLVLVFAAALVALIWVIGPLMAPALWSGMPVKAAMGNVIAIARKRLIEVVLMEVVLYIILSLIGVMLFAGLVPASFSLTALGASIMGDSNAMMAMAASGMGGRGASPLGMLYAGGNTWGLIAGLGVLYCVVGALVTQVGIMGMNLIYLQARGNLDHSEAEDVLDDFMGDVRQKATEAKERARQAAQDLSAKRTADDSAVPPPVASSAAEPASYNSAEAHQHTAYGAAAAAAAGIAASNAGASPAAPMDTAQGESMAREQAMAAERARVAAEAEAARLRAAAEAEAAARARAEEQAAAQRAAEQQAQAQAAAEARAAAQAAEQARQREQAEAAERAAREQALAAEQAARERAEAQAAAQRLREQAEAEARQQEQVRLQAEREMAEREAARLKAQAEAEEKARQAAVSPSCPNCHAHVSADDVFCGECGHKLK